MPEPTRRQPAFDLGEKEMLEGWLDYHRTTLLMKIDGLEDEQMRRVMVPSGVSLLSLVKHLGWAERLWFQIIFLGSRIPGPWLDEDRDAHFRVDPEETLDSVLDFYRAGVRESQAIVARASIDDVARVNEGRGHPTLRWILGHMIEEVARHNGHVDIFRELIDGKTGD